MNTKFIRNEAYYGAAIFNSAETGACNPAISFSLFEYNLAYLKGAAIYNLPSKQNGEVEPKLIKNVFQENKGSIGNNKGN